MSKVQDRAKSLLRRTKTGHDIASAGRSRRYAASNLIY
jgi:hypothetical protein